MQAISKILFTTVYTLAFWYWRWVLPSALRHTSRKAPCEQKSVWFDVGAHVGESTLWHAHRHRDCVVYAFEPNIKAINHAFATLDNYVVVPVAITENDGFTKIYLNSMEEASSTLPLNEEAAAKWQSKKPISVVGGVIVPTMRLDTFMSLMNIQSVDYLKIDAQGSDLSVVRSAGDRIKDIKKVCMEVQVTDEPLYEGAGTKDDMLQYLSENGFQLVEAFQQSHGQEENLLFCRSDS